ncbi:MAG TPA: transglycosylase SLT domain-containing protein [Rectinemataceae bacterium]|nr:transglycosylase SLT domain-containing protein [Rectinemataceae bacterium]
MLSYKPLRAKGAVFLTILAGLINMACAPSREVNLQLDSEVLSLAMNSKSLPKSIEEKNGKDPIAAYYTNTGTKHSVVDFFSSLTKSETIAVAILDNAVKHEVPASLAFAIAYEESRFNPKALNKNATSVDRGLFQLNSTTFPNLSESELYDPSDNAKEGIKYFKHVLDLSGNEVSALAMYNAGRTRVSKSGAPVITLDYISRILNYEKNISSLFTANVVAKTPMLSIIRMGLLEKESKDAQ